MRRAVFLDRDGTINEERDYLWRIEDLSYIEGTAEAISLLKGAGFLVVVVTNQSGIGRGYYSEADLGRLHRQIEDDLRRMGAEVDAWYFCPHHPLHGMGSYGIACDCRKPLPGMLQRASSDLGIDLAASWMIGDKVADVEAGLSAGCRSILVRTGYGAAEAADVPAGVPVVDDLLSAARYLLTRNECRTITKGME